VRQAIRFNVTEGSSVIMANNENIFQSTEPQPLLIVISGPSGVGKDAVVQRLKERKLDFHFVVTTTTRKMRASEVDGVDYNFVSEDEFLRMIAADELIEHAIVYNQYKGVPKAQVRAALASGKDVVMRLDVQGAERVRQLCPSAVLIFLVPTNEEEWYIRLRDRKTETPEELKVRYATARGEMEKIGLFDYVVTNAQDHLDDCVDRIIAIVTAEHLRVVPRKITL